MALFIHFQTRWLAAVATAVAAVTLGAAAALAEGGGPGAVYCQTNAADGNQLAVFVRGGHGDLTPVGTIATGGLGTGAGLGSQGALAFGRNGRVLYAVNAGSDSITVFRLRDAGPEAMQVIGSGGRRPISLAVRHDVLYALNAGSAAGDVDQISGFRIGNDGGLQALANSTRPLSAANVGPAQVDFSPDGRVLVVTEKSTNLIDTYLVGRDGLATGPVSQQSAGMTPFGFAFNRRGELVVSEAFGGAANASAASSYQVDSRTGALTVISASVPTNQTAACWIAITQNGQLAYATDTGSGTITGYSISSSSGKLSRLNADGISGVTGGAPIDEATVGNRFLYALTSTASEGQVAAFGINADGSLQPIGTVGGLPSSSIGLVAQ
jgi:6-phosphogluconolactonase (cycloisomerase 2 family)